MSPRKVCTSPFKSVFSGQLKTHKQHTLLMPRSLDRGGAGLPQQGQMPWEVWSHNSLLKTAGHDQKQALQWLGKFRSPLADSARCGWGGGLRVGRGWVGCAGREDGALLLRVLSLSGSAADRTGLQSRPQKVARRIRARARVMGAARLAPLQRSYWQQAVVDACLE